MDAAAPADTKINEKMEPLAHTVAWMGRAYRLLETLCSTCVRSRLSSQVCISLRSHVFLQAEIRGHEVGVQLIGRQVFDPQEHSVRHPS